MLIEYIATTVEDALLIEESGADRIELVSALTEGGLTPSYAVIEAVARHVGIPVNVMVRPHSQSFVYSGYDLEIMKNDIKAIRSLGANGVVLGIVNVQNEIDRASLEGLLLECNGMEVTFHRAIDGTSNPAQSARILSDYKEITSILTSGGTGDLDIRLAVMSKMKEAAGHIAILAGGGLTKENIKDIHSKVETGHYHFGTAVRKNNSPVEGIDLKRAKEIVKLLKG
ncbi:copper homeostasis protein CutC [Neobacillus piezotolerans]|uniref:PF03932 family protein CutC n=1 Tax=Neobacillus piezotolerans TaxID=2259171 RepID=A0A3D8GLS7_9BACI|nr:copper homeostasis protein CutC [Neobacillus piezotolerans]RDU35358.1 copper homeostasis protein CutC [Neobacillus piezotolerans]